MDVRVTLRIVGKPVVLLRVVPEPPELDVNLTSPLNGKESVDAAKTADIANAYGGK